MTKEATAPTETGFIAPQSTGAFNPDQKAPPLPPAPPPEPKTGVRKRPPPQERETRPDRSKPPPARKRAGKGRAARKKAGSKLHLRVSKGKTASKVVPVVPGQQYVVVVGAGGGGGGGPKPSARGKKRGRFTPPPEVDKLVDEANTLTDLIIKAAGGKLSHENVQGLLTQESNGILEMLIEKNRKYNNSVFEPIRIFSKASAVEQIKVRIDDKLKRVQNMGSDAAPDEDTVFDLIGYLIILRVAVRLGLT